jgi:hypothetical protein
VPPKPTSSITNHSSLAKSYFLHFIGYSRQAKTGFLQTSRFSMANIVNKLSLLSLPCRSWSSNYSVLVPVASSLLFFLFVSQPPLECSSAATAARQCGLGGEQFTSLPLLAACNIRTGRGARAYARKST